MGIDKDRDSRHRPAAWALMIREVFLDFLALLWPTSCVACGAPDRDCCVACLAQVRSARGTASWVSPPTGGAVIVAGPYTGPLRALLLACKHDGRTRFARELGVRLRAPLDQAIGLAHGPSPPLIVTAPSSAARVRQRGYRHVDLIVRAALRGREPETGGHAAASALLTPRALRGRRGRSSQVGLDSAARARNAGLVEVRPGAMRLLRGREVVFVDDIVTTGATATAAREVLTRAGARVVAVVALCAVKRLDALATRESSEKVSAIGEPSGDERAVTGSLRVRREGALFGHPPNPSGRSPWM